MKPGSLIAIIVVFLLAAAGLSVMRESSRGTAASVPAATVGPTELSRSSERVNTLATTPQARAYHQRQDFERRIKHYLRDAPSMGAVERSARAETLTAAIDDATHAAQMSAGEAFLLQAALIKASAIDDDERIQRLARLAERYRRDTAQREADWLARQQRDPRFQDYKMRERAIVAEVMAMSRIPAGLDRDAYLRQRLQQAREQTYR